MAEKEKKPGADGVLKVLKELDEKISLSMSLSASKDSPLGYLRPHMKGLELSCHGVFWISGCLLCLWFTSDSATEAFFFNLVLALFLDILLVAILKASFRRKRPSYNEGDDMFLTLSVDKMSCPSGHTSRAILMALLLVSSSPHLSLLHPVLILWSFSTCLSRVLLGRHHLGDVLIGMILGYAEYHMMNYLWASTETAKWYLDFFRETDSVVGDL